MMRLPKQQRLSRRDLIYTSLAAAAAAGAPPASAAPVPMAGAGNMIELAPGDHAVDRDLTIRGTLSMKPGARIVIAARATLTLLGDLLAPCATIFAGTGMVDLTRSRVIAAHPEWWGATADDAGVDNAPPIEAALAAHVALQLGPGDYHLHRTLVIEKPNRRIWGIGRTDNARGTRLLHVGGDGTVVRVGTEADPKSINAYLRGIDLRWIELGRTVAPGANEQGTGLEVRYVLDCVFEGLRANEHVIGFSFRGAVRTLVSDCAAFRSIFPGRADDTFIGFDMDGRAPPFSTGANASLYLIDCAARTGNRPSLPGAIGCRLSGAFSDTCLVRLETTQLGYGIVVDGGSGTMPKQRYAQLNVHIDTPILDQCGQAGITVRDVGDTAMIDVSSSWISLAVGGKAAIHLSDMRGAMGITGGQVVGVQEGEAAGVLLERANGVTLAGLKLLDVPRPVVARGATAFDISVVVLAGFPRTGAAIDLKECGNGTVRARLIGGPAQFMTGVALDGACRTVRVETTGLGAATTAVRIDAAVPRSVAGVVSIA